MARHRWLLLAPLALAIMSTVVFYGTNRIRAGAEPAIVMRAAHAWVTRWSASRSATSATNRAANRRALTAE